MPNLISILIWSCLVSVLWGFSTVGRSIKRKTLPFEMQRSDSKKLTDWVVENLESEGNIITSSSKTKAGENDTLPESGLCISKFRVMAADCAPPDDDEAFFPVRLLLGRNGWGTGVHPTTRLCLEWLSSEDPFLGGGVFLDYGCGSGILSIAALYMGASHSIGVDVEAEALVTAERNMELNEFNGRFEGLHTREIIPYGLCRPTGVDVCVANILIGQLVRPSMVSALASNIAPNGLLCLSGIRPSEVEALKVAYNSTFEWIESSYAELSASECDGSIESYGFDCGIWARVVGRRLQNDRNSDVERMSELAVS